MKILIVVIWGFLCIVGGDFALDLMTKPNTMGNLAGIVMIGVIILVSVKAHMGLKPYNYIKSKLTRKQKP